MKTASGSDAVFAIAVCMGRVSKIDEMMFAC